MTDFRFRFALTLPLLVSGCAGEDDAANEDTSTLTPSTTVPTSSASMTSTPPVMPTPSPTPSPTPPPVPTPSATMPPPAPTPTMTTPPAPTPSMTAPSGTGGMSGSGPVAVGGSMNGGAGGVPAAACADLTGTGPAALPPIQIAEIAPGSHILLFNQADTPQTLAMLQLCSNLVYYESVTMLTTETQIAAKGYLRLPWNETLWEPADVDAEGGELLLFTNFIAIPSSDSDLLDYVCWGSKSQGRYETEGSQIYTGDCAAPMENGALRRIAGTTGTDAASYDVSVEPSVGDCVAE